MLYYDTQIHFYTKDIFYTINGISYEVFEHQNNFLTGGGVFKKNLMKSPIVSKIFILKSHWFIVQLKRVNI